VEILAGHAVCTGPPRGRADIGQRVPSRRSFAHVHQGAACRFSAALDPTGIELFEEPCRAEDWDANAKVESGSPVPVMLDEPICALADVLRASGIPNIGFCKLELKRFATAELSKADVKTGG
jgi:hypothetical protein